MARFHGRKDGDMSRSKHLRSITSKEKQETKNSQTFCVHEF